MIDHPGVSSSTLTWSDWLLRHVRRCSPLGDLARDYAEDLLDPTTPRDFDSAKDLLMHLDRRGACEGARRAAREAWSAFRKAQRR